MNTEISKALANKLVLSEDFQAMAKAILSATEDFRKYISENKELFENLAKLAENVKDFPERQKANLSEAACNGWYVNWHTPTIFLGNSTKQGKASLDAYMKSHLEKDWEGITSEIIKAVPERKEILMCAFKLHKESNYIASIPLFLAQADGICAEFMGAFLFTEKEKRESAIKKINPAEEDFTSILLHVLGVQTQFGAGISKSSKNRKQLAPNRSGILHGSSKHLDYGTEINSLKSLSLLAFVAFALSGNKNAA
jgi:hypothetical protein